MPFRNSVHRYKCVQQECQNTTETTQQLQLRLFDEQLIIMSLQHHSSFLT